MQSKASLKILMTADPTTWEATIDLASALGTRGVDSVIAVLGGPLTQAQRRVARRARGVLVLESDYRPEWADCPWEDVVASGEWLLNVERQFNPNVVHLSGLCHGALPFRAPTVVMAHSCVLSWWRDAVGIQPPASHAEYRMRAHIGLRAADCVVAPTVAMGAALARHYGPLGGVHVISGGAPVRRHVRMRAPVAKQPIILASHRRWDAERSLSVLQTVAAQTNWPVHIAGPVGEQEPQGALRWLGALSRSAQRRVEEHAGIYLHTVRYDPVGLEPLQAARAGAALVLSDIPALREVWGDAARYVPVDDVSRQVAVLNRLADDPALRLELGARARERAASYRLSSRVDGYLELYRRLSARSRKPLSLPVAVGAETRATRAAGFDAAVV